MDTLAAERLVRINEQLARAGCFAVRCLRGELAIGNVVGIYCPPGSSTTEQGGQVHVNFPKG